jgi:hypothetical protein
MVVMLITGPVLQSLVAYRRQSLLVESQLQAEWLAEAALGRARALRASDATYQGEQWQVQLDPTDGAPMSATVTIEMSAKREDLPPMITATASFPTNSARMATVKRTYTLHESATTDH